MKGGGIQAPSPLLWERAGERGDYMADDIIKLEHDLPKVQKKLREIARKAGSMRPALKGMGAYLDIATDRRFTNQVDPKGEKWQKLKAATLRRKKNSKILTESTKLRDGISSQVQGEDTLLHGSDSPYGAIHQLGGEIEQKGMTLHLKGEGKATRFAKKGDHTRTKTVDRTIKMTARAYLGISREDEEELLAIAGDYLMN